MRQDLKTSLVNPAKGNGAQPRPWEGVTPDAPLYTSDGVKKAPPDFQKKRPGEKGKAPAL